MKKRLLAAMALIAMLALAMNAADEAKLSVGKSDTVRTVLSQQVGKKVTIKLDSGEELGGTVRSVGDKVVHLGELTGKEFYDAVVDLDEVAAVIVRVK